MSLEEARQQRLQALNERKAHKALPKNASGQLNRHRSHELANEAGPSELPSRDTSSSDSGRAGQNGARAGPNAPQGRSSHLFRQNSAAAESRLNRGVSEQGTRRLDRPDEVKGGIDRDASKSGDSGGGGLGPQGIGQKAARPSRLGPGRGNGRPEVPTERGLVKNGRKRPLQVLPCKGTLRPCQAWSCSSICLSLWFLSALPAYMPVCSSVCLSVCPSVLLSVLSVCLLCVFYPKAKQCYMASELIEVVCA